MFTRLCPECNKECHYKKKAYRDAANKKNLVCGSCAQRKRTGTRNSFHGRHHSKATKDKIRAWLSDNKERYQTDAFKQKMSLATSGSKNPMHGRSSYDVWLAKYGPEGAEKLAQKLSETRSRNVTGDKNPMFGKPPPLGCGNGWGGWYKGWYFRSLRELSYMIAVIEKKGYAWISADKKNLAIPYIDQNGKQRTYRADFLVENKWLIEIKPTKLMNTHTNRLKSSAAEEFCKRHGFEYRITDVQLLDPELLLKMCLNEDVRLSARHKNKLEHICKSVKKKK
jgi:hypothetical protein